VGFAALGCKSHIQSLSRTAVGSEESREEKSEKILSKMDHFKNG
jgi:hypothetical protein